MFTERRRENGSGDEEKAKETEKGVVMQKKLDRNS